MSKPRPFEQSQNESDEFPIDWSDPEVPTEDPDALYDEIPDVDDFDIEEGEY